MLTQDACIGWIISLVDAADQDAVKLSLAEADAYLASFGDPAGTAARRADLITRAPRAPAQDRAGGRSDRGHRQRNRRRVMRRRRFVPSKGVVAQWRVVSPFRSLSDLAAGPRRNDRAGARLSRSKPRPRRSEAGRLARPGEKQRSVDSNVVGRGREEVIERRVTRAHVVDLGAMMLMLVHEGDKPPLDGSPADMRAALDRVMALQWTRR
jgi:hypothetical protein